MIRRHSLSALLALSVLLQACGAERAFYYPNKILYHDPDRLGIRCELVRYPSLNGAMLTGLLFPAEGTPKGLIVHFHGNYGNVSHHFPLAFFLVKEGFDVLAFDYQGYGASEGRPSPRNAAEDGVATLRYAATRLRAPGGRIGVFGQSLGAAAAAVAAAREPLARAVVLEAGFTRYRDIAKAVLRRGWLTWPFSFLIPELALPRRYDPVDYVAAISPRPLLIVHGGRDSVVPARMARALYDGAREPKELWVMDGAEHPGRERRPREYEKRIADFFAAELAGPADQSYR